MHDGSGVRRARTAYVSVDAGTLGPPRGGGGWRGTVFRSCQLPAPPQESGRRPFAISGLDLRIGGVPAMQLPLPPYVCDEHDASFGASCDIIKFRAPSLVILAGAFTTLPDADSHLQRPHGVRFAT